MSKLQLLVLPAVPALCLCFCCTQKPAQVNSSATDTVPYNLESPTLTINLSNPDLQEISGLSPTDQKGIYLAIADERGEIFFIDGAGGGATIRRVLFRDKGDFEGVEMAQGALWAAKSDGKLFEVRKWEESQPEVSEYETPLSKKDDVEGLGYDKSKNALLLAGKGDPDSSYTRKIYAFSLKTKQLESNPVYVIDPLEVNRMLPYSDTEKHHFFSPSGVAVHPKTGDIYVVSTALKRLLALDANTGKIKWVVRLDKSLLPQPEGIAFDKSGNLHLSSEGKKGEGLLLRFDYQGN